MSILLRFLSFHKVHGGALCGEASWLDQERKWWEFSAKLVISWEFDGNFDGNSYGICCDLMGLYLWFLVIWWEFVVIWWEIVVGIDRIEVHMDFFFASFLWVCECNKFHRLKDYIIIWPAIKLEATSKRFICSQENVVFQPEKWDIVQQQPATTFQHFRDWPTRKHEHFWTDWWRIFDWL